MKRYFIIFLNLVLFLIACSDPQPIEKIEPADLPESSDKEQVCGGEPTQPEIGFQITEAGVEAELIWRVGFVPWWVRTSPGGRVLAVSDGGDAIYELKPNGSLDIAFQCLGVQIESFTAASDGALWFAARNDERVYRVDASGDVRIMAQHGNNNLEAGPNGEVYAMGEGLVRITLDGEVESITDHVEGRKFAVGPNGEIAVMKDESVFLVNDSGEFIELASGYGPEQWLAFDSDGLLYVTH